MYRRRAFRVDRFEISLTDRRVTETRNSGTVINFGVSRLMPRRQSVSARRYTAVTLGGSCRTEGGRIEGGRDRIGELRASDVVQQQQHSNRSPARHPMGLIR